MSQEQEMDYDIIEILHTEDEDSAGILQKIDNMDTKQFIEKFGLDNKDNIVNAIDPLDTTLEEYPFENWTYNETITLIALRKQRDKKMEKAPAGTKNRIWQEISDELAARGYKKESWVCDEKWRRLKITYNRVKNRMLQKGLKKVKWAFFYPMAEVFNNDVNSSGAVNLGTENTGVNFGNHLQDDHLYHKEFSVNQEKEEDTTFHEQPKKDEEGWNADAISIFLKMKKKYEAQFINAKQGEKVKLWRRISNELGQLGIKMAPEECNSKWRRMKTSFKHLKLKSMNNPKARVKWCYYSSMESILGPNFPFDSYAGEISRCERRSVEGNRAQIDVHDDNPFDMSKILQQSLNDTNTNSPEKKPAKSEQSRPLDVFAAALIGELLHKKKSIIELTKEQNRHFEDRLRRLEEVQRKQIELDRETSDRQERLIRQLEESNKLEEKKIKVLEEYLETFKKQ